MRNPIFLGDDWEEDRECSGCHGEKTIIWEGETITCEDCNGTGVQELERPDVDRD